MTPKEQREILAKALAESVTDLEDLAKARKSVWAKIPLLADAIEAGMPDLRIADAIAEAQEIKAKELKPIVSGFILDRSDTARFGYVSGDKNWVGLAVIPSHRDTLHLVICITYDDKDLAKAQGAKWDRKIGWHWELVDIRAVSKKIKEILANRSLCDAIAINDEISFHLQGISNADFDRAWITETSGAPSRIKEGKAISGSLEDEMLTRAELEERQKKAEYFCALAESEDGIIGFVIKCPFAFKDQVKWAGQYSGGGAKWLPDKKLWLLPLESADLLNPSHRYHGAMKDFWEGFEFSPKAFKYFSKYLNQV